MSLLNVFIDVRGCFSFRLKAVSICPNSFTGRVVLWCGIDADVGPGDPTDRERRLAAVAPPWGREEDLGKMKKMHS